MNYGEIKWNLEINSSIKPFVNKYNRDKIQYPSKINDCKTFEKNNSTIVLNDLYIKEMEICPGYISNNKVKREKNYPFNDL